MSFGQIRPGSELPLTHERVREVLDYNPETGKLTWKKGVRGRKPGRRAGATCGKYRQICIDGINLKEHRLIWFWMNGKWPECLVDHRDSDGLNNRWRNLRAATYSQNNRNRKLSSRNSSGHVGVFPDRCSGKWGAFIGLDGRTKNLGRFECIEDAVAARCSAERHHFGSFARQASRHATTGAT